MAEDAGIFTLAVTTTPRAWPRNNELTQHTRYVRAALGLHPQLVAEREHEIDLWDRYLPEARYVGEVGLDAGPRFYKSLEAQKQVFRHVLERSYAAGDKIITVPQRWVSGGCSGIRGGLFATREGKVVLTGSQERKSETKRAIELGCYFQSMQPCSLMKTFVHDKCHSQG